MSLAGLPRGAVDDATAIIRELFLQQLGRRGPLGGLRDKPDLERKVRPFHAGGMQGQCAVQGGVEVLPDVFNDVLFGRRGVAGDGRGKLLFLADCSLMNRLAYR